MTTETEPTEQQDNPSALNDVLCVTRDELLDLLEYVFEMYENGPACYENPDDYDGYLGNVIHIGDAEFHRIANILNAHRPRTCDTEN